MSSLPSEEGVAILREAAATAHVKAAEEALLRQQIEELSEKLNAAIEIKSKAQRCVIEQLRKMDCAANSNFGWEGRIVWMLGEMAVQAEEHGRRHP